jgi:hypothetical protein
MLHRVEVLPCHQEASSSKVWTGPTEEHMGRYTQTNLCFHSA